MKKPAGLPVNERCVVCDHDTADSEEARIARMTIENLFGPQLYLCEDCAAAIRSAEEGRTLSDEEVRNFVRGGSFASVASNAG